MVEGSLSLLKNAVMNLILSNFVIKSIRKIEDMKRWSWRAFDRNVALLNSDHTSKVTEMNEQGSSFQRLN